MISSRDSAPDSKRSKLRASFAAIEIELARFPNPDLRASVADVVQQLALGPEPEVRPCPACSRIVMRAATLCGHCWTKLTPPSGPDGVAG